MPYRNFKLVLRIANIQLLRDVDSKALYIKVGKRHRRKLW